MLQPSSRPRTFSRAFVILLLVAALSVPLWLGRLGTWLVRTDPPAPSDAILVLAGDYSGNRVLQGARLARAGYASKVYVSGPSGMFGKHECDYAIDFAVRTGGFPESIFVAAPHNARSTLEEAQQTLPLLRAAQVHTLLIVTSDFHTRRASRIFRSLAPDMTIRMAAAEGDNFDPAHWWREREWRKTILLEWTKTLTGLVGL